MALPIQSMLHVTSRLSGRISCDLPGYCLPENPRPHLLRLFDPRVFKRQSDSDASGAHPPQDPYTQSLKEYQIASVTTVHLKRNSNIMDIQRHANRVMAETENILGDARSWMQNFLNADQQKNDVINALIQKLEKDQAEISQLLRDLSAEREFRHTFQKNAEKHELNIQKLEQKINDGSFIAVLIDGDGAKFADAFLQRPVEGAVRAAQVLKQAVRDYVNDEFSELYDEDIPILIRVYANLNDLAKSLRLSNVIERDEDMKLFAEQLTNSRAEVDFVNVGRGKENADSKIRSCYNLFFSILLLSFNVTWVMKALTLFLAEMLSHYHRSLQCKKIFIACCHDNGYLHDLRDYGDTAEPYRKIVLVETTPAQPLFHTLGFPITRFDSVFRSQPLLNEIQHVSNLPVRPASMLPPLPMHSVQSAQSTQPPIPRQDNIVSRIPATASPDQSQQQLVQTPTNLDYQHSQAAGKGEVEQHSSRSSLASPNVVHSTNGGTSIRYATAGGSPTEYQNITLKSGKSKKPPKTILYNEDGCRIDPSTKHPSNSPAQGAYQIKLDKITPNAFCNDHYLVGICRRVQCDRVHNVDLTPAEVAIHRYKARTSVCPRGPECDDYDCYLSHHCLKDPRCTRGSACKFTNTDYGNLHLDTSEKLHPATKWTQGSDFPEHL
ncbi:hypothetical protein BX600DRAFT_472904 [Xylariales sp. PMI_506]|nr:hypothetical protein BX600DRAFT_472904 [Xylariales sp. PMI_506]